jgi:hypothetical protein
MSATFSAYTSKLSRTNRRWGFLVFALVIFSIQFLLPLDGLSWLGFYRSLATCILAFAVILAVFERNPLSRQWLTDSNETEQLRNVRLTRDFVLAFIIGGAIVLLLYSLQFVLPDKSGSREVLALLGAGGLLGMASMMSGALLGFLFGIPRFLRERQTGTGQSASTTSNTAQRLANSATFTPPETNARTDVQSRTGQFQSNTNLEEISDWLTKIIVGLGLTKLAKLPDYVTRLTWFVSHSIGEGHQAFTQDVAFSLMTAFSICGFLMGYLMTRLFLQQAFDTTLQSQLNEKFNAEIQSAAKQELSASAVPDAAALGSAIQRALTVQSTSQGVSETVIRDQIRRLAKDYEAVRLSMSSGDERTKAMEQVAAQMKSLGFAVQPFLNELRNSDSAGERLAAVTALGVKPQEDSLDWLVDRIDSERPFVGYHAALALLAAARAFTPPSPAAPDSPSQKASDMPSGPYAHLCKAIDRAMKLLEDKSLRETDRYEVLQAAKKESACA